MPSQEDQEILKYLEVKVTKKSYLISIADIVTVLLPHKVEFEKAGGEEGSRRFYYRGTLYPLYDLREMLTGIPSREPTKEEKIVLVRCPSFVGGLTVDSVSKVFPFPISLLKPLPFLLRKGENQCIDNLILWEDNIYMVINIEKLLKEEEIRRILPAPEEIRMNENKEKR